MSEYTFKLHMEYCHDPQLEEEHIDAERDFTLKAYDINEDDISSEEHCALLKGKLFICDKISQQMPYFLDEGNEQDAQFAALFSFDERCAYAPEVLKHFGGDVSPNKFIILYEIEVSKEHRGNDLGHDMLNFIIELFEDSVDLFVLKAFPLQFSSSNKENKKPSEFGNVSQKNAADKLVKLYKRSDFKVLHFDEPPSEEGKYMLRTSFQTV